MSKKCVSPARACLTCGWMRGSTVCVRLTRDLLQEVQARPADPRHANGQSYRCLALIVPGVGVSSVRVEHLCAQHIIPQSWEVQRCLTVLQTSQISVCSPLEEHAAVGVIAFDDSVAEQEAILDVNVGAVVQENAHAAGALTDDGQLKWRGPFVTQWIHLSPELEKEAHEWVAAIVSRHVQRRPAVVAFGVNNVSAIVRLQHQSGDACTTVHGSIVKCCETTNEVFHCGIGCGGEQGQTSNKAGSVCWQSKRFWFVDSGAAHTWRIAGFFCPQ